MKKIRPFLIIVSILIPLFILSGCEAGEEGAEVTNFFNHIGESFVWFFTNLTPRYFSNIGSIWNMMSVIDVVWEIPSFIGGVLGVLMTIFVFIIVVLLSILFVAGYLLLLVIFLAIFILLFALALIGTIIALLSLLILSS